MSQDDERRRYWPSANSMRLAEGPDGSVVKISQAGCSVGAAFDSAAYPASFAVVQPQAIMADWQTPPRARGIIEVDDGEICAASAEAEEIALTLALAVLRQRLENAGLDVRTAVAASEALSEYNIAERLDALLGTNKYVAEPTDTERALAVQVNAIWTDLVGEHECETGHIGVVPGGVRRPLN